MPDKEQLEVMKYSYKVLQGLVKQINERIKDAQEGIDENSPNLIMGSLSGIDEAADRIKNVFSVMQYLHQNKA